MLSHVESKGSIGTYMIINIIDNNIPNVCIYVDLGSLFRTRCTSCSTVEDNYNSPIVPALKDKGYVYTLQVR